MWWRWSSTLWMASPSKTSGAVSASPQNTLPLVFCTQDANGGSKHATTFANMCSLYLRSVLPATCMIYPASTGPHMQTVTLYMTSGEFSAGWLSW